MPSTFLFTKWFPVGEDIETISKHRQVLDKYLGSKQADWVYSVERAPTNNRLHFQGCIKFHSLKNTKSETAKWHEQDTYLSPAHNNDAVETYVTKPQTHVAGPFGNKKKYCGEDLKIDWTPMQEEIKKEIMGSNSDRHILWFYDPVGCSGKSKVAKWFAYEHKALILGYSSADNLKYAVGKAKPDIVIVNLTKAKPAHLGVADLYNALESCKDGMVFSGKYESENICWNPPIVAVFSNYKPVVECLAKNRFMLYHIYSDDDIKNCYMIKPTKPLH